MLPHLDGRSEPDTSFLVPTPHPHCPDPIAEGLILLLPPLPLSSGGTLVVLV